MSGRSKTELVIASHLEREGEDRSRFVDLGMEWRAADDVLLRVGGRWDTKDRLYVADTASAVVRRLIGQQTQPTEAFRDWLSANLAYRRALASGLDRDAAHAAAWGEYEPVYRLHFYGGRRGGKTWLASQALVAACIAIPGCRAVVVSPNLSRTAEIRDLVRASLPASWARFRRAELTFDLANGSRVECHTATGSELKLGPVDIALVNEAQEMPERPVLDIRGNLIDKGGLLILAYNPPRRAVGLWTREEWSRVESGDDRNAESYFFDPRKNPHIDLCALESNRYSTQEYRREILGDMSVPLDKVVFPMWDAGEHVLPAVPFGWVDNTREITGDYYGHAAPWVGGLDFDKDAGCAWTLGRFYRRPDDTIALVWHSGLRERDYQEWQLDERLLAATDAYGRPALSSRRDVAWCADASGRWQNTERDRESPNSWRRLQGKGWKVCAPDPTSDGNPRTDGRFDLAKSLLRDRRVYVLESARELAESIRDYPTHENTGEPKRRHPTAHINDAWTYAAYRYFVERPTQDTSSRAATGVPESRSLRKNRDRIKSW